MYCFQLFHEETPDYGLTTSDATAQNARNITTTNVGGESYKPQCCPGEFHFVFLIAGDSITSGDEVTNCTTNYIDFNELFDDSIDETNITELTKPVLESTVNTPLVVKLEPVFPNLQTQKR